MGFPITQRQQRIRIEGLFYFICMCAQLLPRNAPSRHDQPPRSRHDPPPRSRHDQPPRSRHEQPPRSRHDQPRAPRSRHDQPLRSRHEQPPRSRHDQPSRSRHDQPPRSRHDHHLQVFDQTTLSTLSAKEIGSKGNVITIVQSSALSNYN